MLGIQTRIEIEISREGRKYVDVHKETSWKNWEC